MEDLEGCDGYGHRARILDDGRTVFVVITDARLDTVDRVRARQQTLARLIEAEITEHGVLGAYTVTYADAPLVP